VLDFVIKGATPAEVDAEIARVSGQLNPQYGDCRLVIEGESGRIYDIPVTYTSGFQPAREHDRSLHAKCRVTFRAHQPYYRAVDVIEVGIDFPVTGSGAVTTSWDAPIDWDAPVGWDGSDVGVDGTVRVAVPVTATAPSWPTWEITGPADTVTLHNGTTGETIEWSGVVGAGETLVIQTEELSRSVRIDGSTAWLGLTDASRFWSLKPGSPARAQINEVFVAVGGAAGTTSARMLVRPQWLSPE
jgi:hypothetical protein